jgi:hypothetical protein
MDTLCKILEFLEILPSWVVKYWLQFLRIIPISDFYTRLAALLEFIDWNFRTQDLESLSIG